MIRLPKIWLVIGAVLLLPMLPVFGLVELLEDQVESWREEPPPPWAMAAAVAGILASDIFLVVPSSTVSTLGGKVLGIWLGTAASWVGMTVGAVIGFALARWLGRPLAERLSSREELERMELLGRRYGPRILVIARAVPLMAEASVLLFGATGLPWRRFLLPVMASNLGIALAYSAFGQLADYLQSTLFAVAMSIAVPVLLATMVRKWLPPETT